MGRTFLWAGIHHFGDDKFVLGFLSHVKTFHDVYAVHQSVDCSDADVTDRVRPSLDRRVTDTPSV